ncbi:MAG: radical SAM protein [Vulcanimicrobiota bacterium]
MNNAIYETQKCAARLDPVGDFPAVILIDTVSFCNLRCSMCFHHAMQRPRGYMAAELFEQIVDEIALENPHARVWMVFFGEALLRRRHPPTIFDKIRYAKSRGLTDVVLNSNGTLLDQRAASDLLDSGLDAIYIGIDACSPETYSRVRVGGDYQRVVSNVRHLLKLREQRGEKLEVYVQFVEMEENIDEKQGFIDFWNQQGAAVKIRPKVSWAGKVQAANLVAGQDERRPCYWATQSMSITDRGQVVMCAVDLDAQFVAGDVNRSTLKQIWNGPLAKLRGHHLDSNWDALPRVCRECRDWQAARADFYSVDPT